MAPGSPGGSRTTSRTPATRAIAASRRSRSATVGLLGARPACRAVRRAPVRTRPAALRSPVGAFARGPCGEVDDEEIDRPTLDERAGHRQALVERVGSQHDEPFEPDAAGHGLHRVEAAREVEPGGDRAGRLGLRHEAHGQGGLAARMVAAEGEAGLAGDAAEAEDRVEGGEAGPDDRALVGSWRDIGECRHLGRQRHRGQRPDHLPHRPRSCRSPASLKGRQGRRDVGGSVGHRPYMIGDICSMTSMGDEPCFGRMSRRVVVHSRPRSALSTADPRIRRVGM